MCLYDIGTKNNDIINSVKKEQTRYFRAIEELQSSVVLLSERTDRTDTIVTEQSECIKMLAYRSIDQEARSRRNNLILYGVSENHTINTVQFVLNFLEDELNIYTDNIVIERAHRLRPRSSPHSNAQDPKRPIIVRFRDYMDTEVIMRNAYRLKGSPFGIDRDYPKEISIARKQLYSSNEAREARYNRRKVQIVYPAKLIVDGQLKTNKFPEWHRYMAKDRLEEVNALQKPLGNQRVRGIDEPQHIVRDNENVSEKESSVCSKSCAESESESVFNSIPTSREDKIPTDNQATSQSRESTASVTQENKDPSIHVRGRRTTRGRQSSRSVSTHKANVTPKSSSKQQSVKPTVTSKQSGSKNRTVVSQPTPTQNNVDSTVSSQQSGSKNRTGVSQPKPAQNNGDSINI